MTISMLHIGIMIKKVLVDTGMCQKGFYYKEIQRGFLLKLDSTNLIQCFELTSDEENFIMTYYSGEDYEEVDSFR